MSPVEHSDSLALPGVPPPALRDAYEAFTPHTKAALRVHLLGGTSSAILANWLSRARPVSARTIRRYRSSLEGGV